MTVQNSPLLRAVAAAVVAMALSGCVSLLPKSEPSQLYSFGRGPVAAPAASASGPRVGVLLTSVTMSRAATGDDILTMNGTQAAYIAESRWVAPAVVLFREAVERWFDVSATRTRLIARGDVGRAPLILTLDVREFEAVYPAGVESVPDVAVTVRARITHADGQALDDRLFEVRRSAGANRVSTIVDGLDQGLAEILDEVVVWTDAAAASLPPQPNSPA